jgi:hypothetical protein
MSALSKIKAVKELGAGGLGGMVPGMTDMPGFQTGAGARRQRA